MIKEISKKFEYIIYYINNNVRFRINRRNKKKCIEKDEINGKIKFNFILEMFNKLNIFESSEIVLQFCKGLFKHNNFIPLSNIIPRYNSEYYINYVENCEKKKN